MFRDRTEAGRRLAGPIAPLSGGAPYVLAIPRGGVVVGAEVAAIILSPLDVIVPRKLRAPYNPELAIGAVAHDGSVYLDPGLSGGSVADGYLQEETGFQRVEITRRMMLYRGQASYPPMDGRTAIVIDDGIATGSTMIAACRAVRKMGPERLIVGVPVAPADAVDRLKGEADQVVCLLTPSLFYAVGQFYEDFAQVSDEEVIELLREAEVRMSRDDGTGTASGRSQPAQD